ncbi:MAG TPA: STAS/SEC14 domain-containing protein [Rhodocyclaceae bacterium]|jgi:hypothetical protein|nr:STAS/SEC14 domain-containing protein [Rhodocyclaceae bacterium]
MIGFSLDTDLGILYLRPTGPLTSDDFKQLAEAVDPWIEEAGQLHALIIEPESFPGWDSFGALVSHFRFVRDHHKKIRKVAIVTDSAAGDIAEQFASHFVAAEIKHFSAGQREAAKQWAIA